MAEALGWGEEPATLRSNHTSSGRIPGGAPRSLDRPSFTLLGAPTPGRSNLVDLAQEPPGPGWARRRPATTVLGESRVFGAGQLAAQRPPRERVRRETVRVTVEQASILQGFRHDYPWQGTRTERFPQIGNAVRRRWRARPRRGDGPEPRGRQQTGEGQAMRPASRVPRPFRWTFPRCFRRAFPIRSGRSGEIRRRFADRRGRVLPTSLRSIEVWS